MRGVAKSFASFSWAMTMFSIEQLTNLVSEERSGNRKERLINGFDSLTDATSTMLGERTRSMYDAGARLQQDLVDLTFDVCRPENWSPEKVLDRAADLAESSADALRETSDKEKTGSKEGRTKKGKESKVAADAG